MTTKQQTTIHKAGEHLHIGRRPGGTRLFLHDDNGDPSRRLKVDIIPEAGKEIAPGTFIKTAPTTTVKEGADPHVTKNQKARPGGIGVTSTKMVIHPPSDAAATHRLVANPTTQNVSKTDTKVQMHGAMTPEQIEELKRSMQAPPPPVDASATAAEASAPVTEDPVVVTTDENADTDPAPDAKAAE